MQVRAKLPPGVDGWGYSLKGPHGHGGRQRLPHHPHLLPAAAHRGPQGPTLQAPEVAAALHHCMHGCLPSLAVSSRCFQLLPVIWCSLRSPAPCAGLHSLKVESLCCGVPQVQAGQPKKKKSKGHMGMKESFTFLAKSPYIPGPGHSGEQTQPRTPHLQASSLCLCSGLQQHFPVQGHAFQLLEACSCSCAGPPSPAEHQLDLCAPTACGCKHTAQVCGPSRWRGACGHKAVRQGDSSTSAAHVAYGHSQQHPPS